MAAEIDITTFSDGEDVIIELFAKDDDGVALTDTSNETIRMNVALRRDQDVPDLTVDAAPNVVLTDAGLGQWTITLDAVDDLSGVITPGAAYHYSIWSINSVTGKTYHQARGRLVLQRSVGPFV